MTCCFFPTSGTINVIRSNTRDVPSNMKMFPNDVTTAEQMTHGNPDILQDEEFAPKEKEDYSELFGKKTPKRGKDSAKKDTPTFRSRDSLAKSSERRNLSTPSSNRIITHRRFITKALEGRSDHEVRIRSQIERDRADESSKLYNCHLCGFSSSRINVIVLHNKSHSAGYADAYLHPQKLSGKTGKKAKGEKRLTFSGDKRQRVYDTNKSDEPVVKKKVTRAVKDIISPNESTVSNSAKENDAENDPTPLKKPVFGRKKSAKYKAEKIAREKEQSDEFRKNLLKDWDDEDNEMDDDEDSKMETSNEKDNSIDTSVKGRQEKDRSQTKSKEKSCFDFDDSEDGLDIGETVMKFGQKIPRILGDKSKKQTKDISVNEHNQCNDTTLGEEIEVSREHNDLELNKEETRSDNINNIEGGKVIEDPDAKAFESLLDETSVPTLPRVPTELDIKTFSNLDTEGNSNNDTDGEDVSNGNINQVVDGGTGEINDSGGSILVDKSGETSSVRLSDVTGSSFSNEFQLKGHSDELVKKDEAFSDSEQHFLVKTSEEVATSSSDDVHLENATSPNENNVAIERNEIANDLLEISKVCLLPGIDNVSNVGESKASAALVSDFASGISPVQPVVQDDTGKSTNNDIRIHDGNLKVDNLVACASIEKESLESVAKLATEEKSEISTFHEMDFDINSMPVIIGDDMVANAQEQAVVASPAAPLTEAADFSQTVCMPSLPKELAPCLDNELITIKRMPKLVSPADTSANSSNMKMVVKEDVSYEGSRADVTGKDSKWTAKKVMLSPTKTVATTRPTQMATIKVQPSTATTINRLAMGGNALQIAQKGVVGGTTSQVLILKSTTAGGKSTLQKLGTSSQMIQQGGKVLILTNPQGGSGQTKLITQKTVPGSSLGGSRILTTKGTVLTTASPVVSTKANLLPGSTKTVTTKSGQKIVINNKSSVLSTPKSVIINKSGLLTPTVISSKTPLITQNIISSKPETTVTSHLNLSPFTGSVTSKGATAANIISASGLTNKGNMVLTPVSIGKNSPLMGGQKLKLITSKAGPGSVMAAGTKLMVQTTPSRVILPSSSLQKNQLKLVGNLKNQPTTNTILIQTSQGVIATTPLSSSQVVTKTKAATKSMTPPILIPTVMSSKPSPIHVTQSTLQSPSKLVVQKVKAGPNILQRSQRRPAQRVNKRVAPSNQLVTTSAVPQQNIHTTVLAQGTIAQDTTPSSSQETLILSSTSGLPVISQSGIMTNAQLESSNQPQALLYLAVDESGNYRPLESTPVVTSTDSQTLYIDPGSSGTDLDNIFLAIDEAGNVVNISQPVQTQNTCYTTETATPPPSQDILAKALADTQVLQQETLAETSLSTDNTLSRSLSNCMFVGQSSQYPQQSLSHSVLETSLTLNQPPIMTPLEVPSAVSPASLAHLQTGFITDSGLMTATKGKKADVQPHPSMPLLTEETNCSSSVKNETVYFTQVDGSHAVLTPVSSGSQLSFQLALDGSNVIVSSPGLPSLGGIISNSIEPQNNTLASDLKPPVEFPCISDHVNDIDQNEEASVSAEITNESASTIGEDISLRDHTNNDPLITKGITLEQGQSDTNLPTSMSAQQSTEIEIKVDCSDVSIDGGEHCADLVTDVGLPAESAGAVVDHSMDEAYEKAVTDVTYSNGDITQRIVTKRLSDDSTGLIVSENGSEFKRVKLDER